MAFPSSVVVDPPLYPTREPTAKEVADYVNALKECMKTIHPRALANIK